MEGNHTKCTDSTTKVLAAVVGVVGEPLHYVLKAVNAISDERVTDTTTH